MCILLQKGVMKRQLILIPFVLLLSISYGQKQDALLSKAYKAKSLTQLETFFEYWSSETPPLSDIEF
jgi:hypothetical protein